MADQSDSGGQEKPDRDDENRDFRGAPQGAPAGNVGGGFLHVYKPGQGYWTRMFTAVGAIALMAVIDQFIYTSLMVHGVPPLTNAWVGVIVGVLAVAAVVVGWIYLNKPRVVDFLIATESEMRKVNWTSRKDLIGSTKVVIVFMFLIAGLLFVIDIVFGWLFFMAGILKHGPFS